MIPVMSGRTISKFTDQRVENEALQALLRAAMEAPSAGDERPWHFIVLRDHTIRDTIRMAIPEAFMVTQTPVSIVLCGDTSLQKHIGCWPLDCAAATENILIRARRMKLAAIWLGMYPIEGRIQHFRELLRIPEHVVPFSLIVVGHPTTWWEHGNRFLAARVHHDRW